MVAGIGASHKPGGNVLCVVALIAASLIPSVGRAQDPVEGDPASPWVIFEDASNLLDFCHGSRTLGGDSLAGAAWLDYDNDGDLDLFLTNAKETPNALFRNDGDGVFVDVAVEAGVANGLGNTGVLAADFDNDGFKDLFLTGEGDVEGDGVQSPVQLYHNNGDGTFTDITDASGIGATLMIAVGGISRRGGGEQRFVQQTASHAAAGDIDNDGFLDLFIGAAGSLVSKTQHRNHLYRNNGDLTFTDISAAAGVDTMLGACAASFTDYDRDGWIDLVVADCNEVNFVLTPIELFRNNGDLTFTDVRVQAGTDIPGFWMGLAFADYDNDGDLDFFSTNTGGARENVLLRNNGDGTYANVTAAAGIGNLEFGWGCTFTDFNNDGYADIFFAGGLGGNRNPGRMLFNMRNGTFSDASAICLPGGCSGGGITRRGGGDGSTDERLPRPTVAIPIDMRALDRVSGVAQGDYDNDGFADIIIMVYPNTAGEPCQPILLHNAGNDNHWVTIRLVGTRSNRDAIGARVEVDAGPLTQTKEVFAGSSFQSTESPWLTFGLAEHDGTDRVEVTWPLGLVEVFPNIATRQTVTLVEGQGTVETAGPELIGVVDAAGDTWISPLGESVGLSSFRIEASEALTLRGDPKVVVTGGATLVAGLVNEADGTHVVELTPAPEPGQWVKITLPVTGEVSGADSDLTLWVAHHPGDLNGDGNVNITDATAFGELFRADGPLTLADLNGDGAVNVRDATTFGEIWRGTDTTRAWNGSALPEKPE